MGKKEIKLTINEKAQCDNPKDKSLQIYWHLTMDKIKTQKLD